MNKTATTMTNSIDLAGEQLIALWNKTVAMSPSLLVGMIIFLIFLFASKPVSALLIKPIGFLNASVLVNNVIRRSISLFIILLGLYIFLSIAGLTQAAVAIISGTGVIGIVIGFAFKDIAENFLASLLLSVHKPFRIGDVIEVQGQTGIVDKVTARGTTLVDFDGNHIQLPNATIYKSTIKNFSANPWIRGSFTLGIGYDSSIETSRQIILDTLNEQDFVLNDPEPQVLVDALGSATINLVVYFWIDGHKHAVAKVASILMRLSLRRLEAAGISMPDDAREIIFPEGIPLSPSNTGATKPERTSYDSDLSDSIDHDITPTSSEALESDTQDIIEQAKNARDPEGGESII